MGRLIYAVSAAYDREVVMIDPAAFAFISMEPPPKKGGATPAEIAAWDVQGAA